MFKRLFPKKDKEQLPETERDQPAEPAEPVSGEHLPFPPVPSGSIAKETMQESTYNPLPKPKYLKDGVPNILIVLIDDAGPALPETFGGEIHTPTMNKLVEEGIAYNRFHTTAMCSPTRASLLTGRNHHICASGQIAELANDWDGYTGLIPQSCALVPDVLRMYGYATAMWGKWHNTPSIETGPTGPFSEWPTGRGFEYSYGFWGACSQYEPNLFQNETYLPIPPHSDTYHVTEDMVENCTEWLRLHKAMQPDKPFFLYFAPGAIHGPHHVRNEWSDKYKNKFNYGWDAYRERAFKQAKDKGWIPQDAELTPRHHTMQAWEEIPKAHRPFQCRLMEVLAGFAEHTDVQVGKVVDELDRLGYGENTIIFYIWGDNGSSAEGQNGTICELLAQNGIPTTTNQQLKALADIGGLDALGGDKCENMYHAGWGWAGSSPYKGTKLLASYFGGTRNPLAIRWPKGIKHDVTAHPQFHHVNDIVPTIYELCGITPPKTVKGIEQDPINGVSMAYSFADAKVEGRLGTQYFEVMGSRAIYHEGWIACAFGPRVPWLPGTPEGIEEWNPNNDVWELYDVRLGSDWSQNNDLAKSQPEKLAEMQQLFLAEAEKNKAFPVGGGLYIPALHPELMLTPPNTEWEFTGAMTRIPEAVAPKLGNRANIMEIDVEFPQRAEGVLYKLGGFAGGVTLFCLDGFLHYEYNLLLMNRTKLKSETRIPAGHYRVVVNTNWIREDEMGKPLRITISIDNKQVIRGIVPVSIPMVFTPNECLDFGQWLGSPVSDDYYDKYPFKFNGKIEKVHIKYTEFKREEGQVEEMLEEKVEAKVEEMLGKEKVIAPFGAID